MSIYGVQPFNLVATLLYLMMSRRTEHHHQRCKDFHFSAHSRQKISPMFKPCFTLDSNMDALERQTRYAKPEHISHFAW